MTLTELRRLEHLPKPHDTWRTCPYPYIVGEINGIPNIRGAAIATNGILVALQTCTNEVLFGHIQWFIADEMDEDEARQALVNAASDKPRDTALLALDEFIL